MACVYMLLNDNKNVFILFSFNEYFSFQMTIKIQEINDAKYIYLIVVEDRVCTAFVFYFSVGCCFNTACYHNFFPAQFLYIKIQVFYRIEMKGNNCFHIFFKNFLNGGDIKFYTVLSTDFFFKQIFTNSL